MSSDPILTSGTQVPNIYPVHEQDALTEDELEELRENFYNEIEDAHVLGNYEDYLIIARKYQVLQGEVDYADKLITGLERASDDEGYDFLRKLAMVDGLMNETVAFPRLVQAICYLKIGNRQSAFDILNSLDYPVAEMLEYIPKLYKDHPRVSNLLNELYLFYFKAKEKEQTSSMHPTNRV